MAIPKETTEPRVTGEGLRLLADIVYLAVKDTNKVSDQRDFVLESISTILVGSGFNIRNREKKEVLDSLMHEVNGNDLFEDHALVESVFTDLEWAFDNLDKNREEILKRAIELRGIRERIKKEMNNNV